MIPATIPAKRTAEKSSSTRTRKKTTTCGAVVSVSADESQEKSNFSVDGPWGKEPIDLSEVELTYEQKCWLANQHIVEKVPVSQLHAKYKIRSARLWFYIKGLKNGSLYTGRTGRPLLLDKISILAVLEQLYDNPQVDPSGLRDLVRAEFRRSVDRKQATLQNSSEILSRTLPHTTVLRYCRKLQGWFGEYSRRRKIAQAIGRKRSAIEEVRQIEQAMVDCVIM